MKLFCETSSTFELDNVKNAAILSDFLNFWSWQRQKRSNSARLSHFFKLTTSKTKQFCETSFKNGKLSAELTASYQCVLRFFHSICLNYCACHEKVMPGHTKCCTCHAKSSQQTWRSDAQMQPLSGNQRPDLLTALMNMSLVLRLTRKMQILFKCPTPAIVFGNATKPSRFAHFWQGAQSLAPATRNDIWTSKSGPNPWCFLHFDFEMCFAPQRRALSRHLDISTSKSGPDLVCFVHFEDLLSSETFSFFFSSLLWLSSLTLPISAFHLSILSEVWLLNFLR